MYSIEYYISYVHFDSKGNVEFARVDVVELI